MIRLLTLISRLPFWWLYRLSDILFLFAFYLVRYRRNTVLSNLEKSFPELSKRNLHCIVKSFYRHFGDIIVESLKLRTVSKSSLRKRLDINMGPLTELLEKNEPVIIYGSHYANWEWIISLPWLTGTAMTGIYKPLKNTSIDQWIYEARSRFGSQLLEFKGSMNKIRSINGAHLIYLISDQFPPNDYTEIGFLNQNTRFHASIDRIHNNLKLTPVFCSVSKVKRGYYTVDFQVLSGENMAQAYARKLEQKIMEEPSLWLWTHRRWKN